MADKAISELIAANQVNPTDLFVLEQSGTAKKLTGQILENWLVSFADGHGGIQSIAKIGTSGLVDTYRITLADTTTFDFAVTNGKSINSITKTGTSGLVDTYTIDYNDGTKGTFTITNGAKGDKGDNTYTHIKFASQEPTASSHSMGDVPDKWIGFYWGNSSTAPTDWTLYKWYQFKGDKGETGAAATVTRNVVEYQVSDSGTIIPSGSWGANVPVVAQGRYLWTRTTTTFNSGSSAVSYSVSRMGLDGSGAVSSVANISPDANGNVPLDAENVGALPSTGGDLTGELRMNGQPISGLNAPTANDQAANMGFVNQQARKAAPRNLLDNSDFTHPVNQRGQVSYTNSNASAMTFSVDRWKGVNGTWTVKSGYVNFTTAKNATYKRLMQIINGTFKAGKIYTIAMRARINEVGTLRFRPCTSSYGTVSGASHLDIKAKTSGFETFVVSFTPTNDEVNPGFDLLCFNTANDYANIDIEWAACYEGAYTLDTLPEYRPKGYGAELAECRRYYRKSWIGSQSDMSANGSVSFVRATSGSSMPVVSWEQPMASTPTAVTVYSWVGGAGCVRDWGSGSDVSGIGVDYRSPFGFAVTNLSGLTAGKIYCFHYEASADL